MLELCCDCIGIHKTTQDGVPSTKVRPKYYSGNNYWDAELIKVSLNRRDVAATNPRGIPYAPFVDKVEDYVTSRADVEKTLKSFQEMIA